MCERLWSAGSRSFCSFPAGRIFGEDDDTMCEDIEKLVGPQGAIGDDTSNVLSDPLEDKIETSG